MCRFMKFATQTSCRFMKFAWHAIKLVTEELFLVETARCAAEELQCSLQGLGTMLGLPGLSNTALTFALIYACEKSCEHVRERSLWLAVFLGSLALWQAALALRSHPGWLTDLVSAW